MIVFNKKLKKKNKLKKQGNLNKIFKNTYILESKIESSELLGKAINSMGSFVITEIKDNNIFFSSKIEKVEVEVKYDGCCEECGVPTNGRLVAECGFTYACSDCSDKMWEDTFHHDSDGRYRGFYNAYYN